MKRKTSILGTLTARTFRRSKSRNLVAILAILLTTMMFTTLFTLSQSMGQNMTEMYLRQAGTTAHTSTKSILDAEIEKIVSHPDVVSWGKSILVGTVENQALAGRQVEIRFASDSYAESCFASPTTGRLPQRADEIALDTQVLHRLGISPALGQTVTLSWRPDLSSSASISNTFTLCGFWEGNESVYASMAWVSEGLRFIRLRRGRGAGRGANPRHPKPVPDLCRCRWNRGKNRTNSGRLRPDRQGEIYHQPGIQRGDPANDFRGKYPHVCGHGTGISGWIFDHL